MSSAKGGCGSGECVTIEEAIKKRTVSGNWDGKGTIEMSLPGSDASRQHDRVRQKKTKSRRGSKLHFRRALVAEAVGTACIVLFGCGSVCSSLTGAYQGIWQVAAVWGLGVALAICITADSSGAHLNPAITLAFWLVRPRAHGMNAKRALAYVGAQLLGAVLAAAMNLALYGTTIAAFERVSGIVRGEPDSVRSAMAFGEYFPNPGLTYASGSNGPYSIDDVSHLHAVCVEAWGTFILAFVIFAVTHGRNRVTAAPSVIVPLLIGATVSVLLALYAPITQAGWNPARDFGPRLVAAAAGWGKVALPGPRYGFWVYVCADDEWIHRVCTKPPTSNSMS